MKNAVSILFAALLAFASAVPAAAQQRSDSAVERLIDRVLGDDERQARQQAEVLRDGSIDRRSDRRGRDDVYGRDIYRDGRVQKKGNGPPFCRSGEGHPVHGRQWCIDKGWGLGSQRGIFDTRRDDRRFPDRDDRRHPDRDNRTILDDILGRAQGNLERTQGNLQRKQGRLERKQGNLERKQGRIERAKDHIARARKD